jgi:cytochrome c biogenesis protein ResB
MLAAYGQKRSTYIYVLLILIMCLSLNLFVFGSGFFLAIAAFLNLTYLICTLPAAFGSYKRSAIVHGTCGKLKAKSVVCMAAICAVFFADV